MGEMSEAKPKAEGAMIRFIVVDLPPPTLTSFGPPPPEGGDDKLFTHYLHKPRGHPS